MDEAQIQAERRDNEEKATMQRAQVLGLRYFDLRTVEDTTPLYEKLLTVEEIRKNQIIPLVEGKDRVPYQFGITSRTPESFINRMRKEYEENGKNILFLLISETGYRVMLNRYDPPEEVIYDDIEIATEGDSATLEKVSETLNTVRADQLFDFLVTQAERLGASDIHIENMRDSIRVRMRMDGALHVVAKLDKDRYRVLIGEMSSRAGLSVAAASPQSGGFQQDITREDGSSFVLNLRVEMVPTMFGMDAVFRLFNFDEAFLKLDALGIDDASRDEINDIISHPRGLVLVVGPTGSGKSTTLYSILSALNTPDRKIITLEDPIEYSIAGISQIPVRSSQGGSFATGLRSILRLDPDVVMVGEIRDEDTARTAIQASITGHLVLSTFHADSAAAAFVRMIDMIGVNPIFTSAVRLVMAQRLLRKLVPTAREAYQPSASEREWVEEQLARVPDEVKSKYLSDLKLYRPVPNEKAPFGYQGRTAVMEQLIVTEEIKSLLRVDSRDLNALTIENAARDGGMLTMLEKSVLLALDGQTTLEEINRVL